MSDRRRLVFLVLPLLLSTTVVWAQPPTMLFHSPVAVKVSYKVTRKLKIKKKPNPEYTSEAKSGGIQGVVVLRVEFKADGTIGDIQTVRGLPRGLTEKAIEAARLIKFQPEMVNGQPTTKTLTVTYRFSLD
ncbi:MAG TPA: energy transducer TonB [Pyrinomonadaceae bacterium]